MKFDMPGNSDASPRWSEDGPDSDERGREARIHGDTDNSGRWTLTATIGNIQGCS